MVSSGMGKPSFSSNVVEEIRLSCRNLQRSLIMVNLSKIFLGGMQLEIAVNPANISTLFQRCLLVDAMSRLGTMPNKR